MAILTPAGLAISFVGSVVFAFSGTRWVKIPPIEKRAEWETKHKAVNKLVNNIEIYPENSEFTVLKGLIERNFEGSDISIEPVEINYKNRYDMGGNVALEPKRDSEDTLYIGSPAQLRTWIERETQEFFFKWGISLMILGFGLQFLGAIF